MQSIKIKIRSAYGRDIFDPVDEKAKIFAAMTEKKTLTDSALRHIAALGYRIETETGEIPGWLAALSNGNQ